MPFDVDAFGRLLAGRLGAILPAGFAVSYAGGMLCYQADESRLPGSADGCRIGPSGSFARDNFGYGGDTDAERAASTARQALDDLQDYVSEATTEPWPGTRAQPQARAEVRGGVLHLWFEGPGGAVLGCEPIPLAAWLAR